MESPDPLIDEDYGSRTLEALMMMVVVGHMWNMSVLFLC
jgi:hypothetical protein